ncbi:MAG: protein-L-isoaspartate(D-aspartate) O-methyltransferase [Pseudomonadota bacterium]
MVDFAQARERMVERQIARRNVLSPAVLEAMRRTPREAFVPKGMEEFAYEDSPLPIESGQTISQPYIVALMTEAAEVARGDRVLEIGTGSGYAAAVLAEIAGEVFTIERHAGLADTARARFDRLGYRNIAVRTGDGTLGWPEAAPFDAILAAAGGPEVPQTLLDQLAIGGRLVMPVGPESRRQSLIKVVRLGEVEFSQEDLGEVMFVPLVGEHGWREDERAPGAGLLAGEPRSFRERRPEDLPAMVRRAAEPLPAMEDPALGAMFDRFADARVVLLGEASHGTSEFYQARAAITRRLIEKHGFSIVAVEADWPDAASLDRFVRGRPPAPGAEAPFRRFPTWMWRNAEVEAFIGALRAWNEGRSAGGQASFHGLDLYSLSASMRAVLAYLDRVDPEAAAVARERYGCLTPWSREPSSYGRMALSTGYALCETPVVETLRALLDRRLDYAGRDGEDYLDAAHNARLVASAEAYYRAMFYGAAESWNLRDRHMFETLEQLLEARPGARAVVWAHNSHIGDARHTEMGLVREELNLGQLCRERFGDEAALIGFGTHGGTVACASDWEGPLEIKTIRPSMGGSIERVSHDAGLDRWLLDLREGVHPDLRERLLEPRLERFIGVIYRPDTERWSHYAEASLPRQFDAWVWFDETRAVTALPTEMKAGEDETWPFGL